MQFRDDIATFEELPEILTSDATAEKWFAKIRWPDGIRCPTCDSDLINVKATHKTMPYRCNDCYRRFSVKTDSAMHNSKIGYREWALAMYLLAEDVESRACETLPRKLGVSQKTVVQLSNRIKKSYEETNARLDDKA